MLTSKDETIRQPVDVRVDTANIRLVFSDGSEVLTPLSLFPRLQEATEEQRRHWEWIGSHHGIHWPDVDEDIAVHTLIREQQQAPDPVHEVPALIAELYRTTERLGKLFPGRPFTPDGHLVGSIGEVVARYIYGLDLEECSTPQIDARKDGKSVQIKLTGKNGRSYGISWSSQMQGAPDLLICMKLTEEGFVEIYNGPFPVNLLQAKADSRNGQIQLPLSALRDLNPRTLPQVNSLAEFNKNFERDLADVA